jgi:aminoglycoside/choline kinase family phosphotransferase
MADMTPPADAADFLAAHGWSGAVIAPLAGDASFRRYFRVAGDAGNAVLMDAPPPHEDPRPFVDVARWLTDRGFTAPTILAADLDRGLVLIEDLGDDRMREAIETAPARTGALYANAVDVLVDLQRHAAGPWPDYDLAVLEREAGLFVDWYCPAVGIHADAASYRAAWAAVLAEVATPAEPVTVLRDYHVENIMLMSGGGLGLLDFQDALAGHRAYDLVSLLQDARREVEPEIEAAMLDRFCAATDASEDFRRAYHILGAQRNAKILGIFTRLWRRDGKPRYTALCPRVWRYLERDLADPALAPVAAWFDAHVPADRRGDPLTIAAR